VITIEAAEHYALLFNSLLLHNMSELGRTVVIVTKHEMEHGVLLRRLALMPMRKVQDRQRRLRQQAYAFFFLSLFSFLPFFLFFLSSSPYLALRGAPLAGATRARAWRSRRWGCFFL